MAFIGQLSVIFHYQKRKAAADEYGKPCPIYIKLDEPAKKAFQEFREQCRIWENEAEGLMKSHIGKLPGLAVRVSLILMLLDWAIGEDEEPNSSINERHMGRACHYIGEHLRKHAHRAYGAVSVPAEIRGARQVAKIILKDNPVRISTREIQRKRIKELQTSREIGLAIAVLEDAGWLKHSPTFASGRPAKLYDVNPKVWRAK